MIKINPAIKYNLTFWQRLELIPIFYFWILADPKDRQSWHLVKKGMEKHKCNFVVPYTQSGYKFLKCDHPGCNTCDPID